MNEGFSVSCGFVSVVSGHMNCNPGVRRKNGWMRRRGYGVNVFFFVMIVRDGIRGGEGLLSC